MGLGRGLTLSPSDTAEEDEDLYDCVENEEAEGDEIYEDLMRSEAVPTPVRGSGKAGQGGKEWPAAGHLTASGSLLTAQNDGAGQALLLPS